MRCTGKLKTKTQQQIHKSNVKKKAVSVLLTVSAVMVLSGCGETIYELPYEADSEISSYNVIFREKPGIAQSFASDLCIVTENIMNDESVDMSQATSAVLFDINNNDVLYAKNAHERLHPASLTKVMTALVALKYGSTDQVLTASNAVNITESGAVLCGLKSGDTMTLNQALHVLLVQSANDAAMLIAENIGGTVENFAEMMNEEAKALGATNTHFVNPHGLTAEGHYTTAYDLYLIFNEAINYDFFQEIIHMNSYQTTYYNKNGEAKSLSVKNSNKFLRDEYQPPSQVSVIGGKTGTTNAAGHCLMLLSRDINGAPYISVIMRSAANDVLYKEMIDLLDEINK